MISLCKVHDPKNFRFARAYPTKQFIYVRNRPARIRNTIVQSSIVNTHTKSIIRFRKGGEVDFLMIPCLSKVSIVVKSAACFLGFCVRGGALLRATFNSSSFTVR